MEDNGARSNPLAAFETSLERVARVVDARRATSAERLEPRAVPPRAVRIQAEVEAVVRAATRPVRVREVCAALDAAGVSGYNKASVRKTLHDESFQPTPRYRRVGWGLYESIAASPSPASFQIEREWPATRGTVRITLGQCSATSLGAVSAGPALCGDNIIARMCREE